MLAKFVHSKGADRAEEAGRAEDTGRAEDEEDIEDAEVTKKVEGIRCMKWKISRRYIICRRERTSHRNPRKHHREQMLHAHPHPSNPLVHHRFLVCARKSLSFINSLLGSPKQLLKCWWTQVKISIVLQVFGSIPTKRSPKQPI